MRRDELEHVIRAAADVAEDDIVVIGSQAVLAQYPDAPEALLRSLEVDAFPKKARSGRRKSTVWSPWSACGLVLTSYVRVTAR